MDFFKMQGCGNDYIYFDCFDTIIPNPDELSIRLSDRHFGIGGDGIVLILPSSLADARMRMFNADGSEGRMCGNAIRCVAKYLYESGRVKQDRMLVETLSGVKELRLTVMDESVSGVCVDMGRAEFSPSLIPMLLKEEQVVNHPLEVGGETYQITCVSMGNPHCVVFVDDPQKFPIEAVGPLFEHHTAFPDGVNTEFVRVDDEGTLTMRVWERGSGETLACGTGACACVAAAVANGYCQAGQEITVHLRGGDLLIMVTNETVFMTGSAEFVFSGTVDI